MNMNIRFLSVPLVCSKKKLSRRLYAGYRKNRSFWLWFRLRFVEIFTTAMSITHTFMYLLYRDRGDPWYTTGLMLHFRYYG